MDNIPNVSVKRSVLQAAFENIKHQYRCGFKFSTLKDQEDAKEFPAIYYTLKDELEGSENVSLKAQSSLIYNSKKGGFLDYHSDRVKYKVNCGVASPMFVHYAVKALEGYNPELMLQWLYNSVMEEYIEKDKIHETLDGKVLVDKEDLSKILHLYEYIASNSKLGDTLPYLEPYHNLKGVINNDA